MSQPFMNTKEVALYLDIHEKQVYALIKAGRIPATRVTGKWIFPKKMIDEWIETQAKAGIGEARKKSSRIEGALLAAGSNDPVLDLLLTAMQSSHPGLSIFTATMGSTAGLKALGRGDTDIAWSHIFDPERESYNTPEVLEPRLTGLNAVVVHLFNRDLALLVSRDNPMDIHGMDDVLTKKPRFV
ncbi:MAG: substrate-binding domain-containing protein, partial [Syntrophales bacterium]|nr:substrate-binding domain-containing protein [Syntrophales bacterium]